VSHTAEADYLLVDEEGEKKFGFKLADALRRARHAEKKLLDGHTFYITSKVDNIDLLTKVIKSAGGKVCCYNMCFPVYFSHSSSTRLKANLLR
jgi:diaminopimelate decarboxylase